MQKINSKKLLLKAIIAILAIVPIIFFEDFYNHFYAYFSGSIITNVIRNEWHIVAISIVFSMVFFAFLSFRRKIKWLEHGMVGAFFVSLFIEMYGMPLTIIFTAKYFFNPDIVLPKNVFEFYFLNVGFGMDIAMAYGTILIIIGMFLIASGWITLYKSARKKGIANNGVYLYSRHPQYLGFILMILGWFFGWPTALTVIFVPILIYKYVKLCKAEEWEVANEFPEYERYKESVPFLI